MSSTIECEICGLLCTVEDSITFDTELICEFCLSDPVYLGLCEIDNENEWTGDEMKKNKKYYKGPPGVFYNPKYDDIFELINTEKEYCNKNGKIIGRIYQLNRSKEDSKVKKEVAICGMESVIRLGDL